MECVGRIRLVSQLERGHDEHEHKTDTRKKGNNQQDHVMACALPSRFSSTRSPDKHLTSTTTFRI